MTVIAFQCPSCGGSMGFDSESGMLACQSCGRREEIDPFKDTQKQSVFTEGEAEQYHCSNCGADIITEPETTATSCAFCGSNVVLGDRLAGKLAPVQVIPFAISKEEAQRAFKKWCRNGLMTPGGFMTANRIQSIQGIYVPFWLYDLHHDIEVRANATRVRMYSDGDYQYTETQHFDVYRGIVLDYLKVPADASEKMNDELMDKLEPYPYEKLTPFATPYLAGYLAEKYTYTNRELLPRAQEKIASYVESYIHSTMDGYQSVMYRSKDVLASVKRADYTLLPVWMVKYDYKGKTYTFAMNGQTGKVVGKPPLSRGKMALWFGGVFLAVLLGMKSISLSMGGGFW
ncbi:TFIIB-type zinc ribbon-containing protein [Paenibacillus sp. PL2-23]|uniref:TFIIB-type zinc ribbon-containing protein n=1 Tax=Paenibacillus sp. PL2-23 TaxID=2100729 RepID=UPI0030FBD98B